MNLILPTFNEPNRKKRCLSAVIGTVASKITELAFEGISSFLHHKRHKALNTAIKQRNVHCLRNEQCACTCDLKQTRWLSDAVQV